MIEWANEQSLAIFAVVAAFLQYNAQQNANKGYCFRVCGRICRKVNNFRGYECQFVELLLPAT